MRLSLYDPNFDAMSRPAILARYVAILSLASGLTYGSFCVIIKNMPDLFDSQPKVGCTALPCHPATLASTYNNIAYTRAALSAFAAR
jgi:hypothetical protein